MVMEGESKSNLSCFNYYYGCFYNTFYNILVIYHGSQDLLIEDTEGKHRPSVNHWHIHVYQH
jgi:hypothetical protein